MTDREIAFIILSGECGRVLSNRELFPQDIFKIACRFLFTGCKSRGEYEYLVNFLIDDPDFRKELLK